MTTERKTKLRAAKSQNFRIRVEDSMGNVSYITREGGKVQYFSGSEQPLALANIAGNKAAILRFAIQDALTARDAAHAIRYNATYSTKVDVIS